MNSKSFDLESIKALFARRPPRLGVHVEEHSIKIVRVEKNDDDLLQVVSYGELDISLQNINILEQQRFKAALSQLGGKITKAAINIEHPSLRIRRMIFPKMPDKDVIEAVKWNLREQVEGSIDNYVVGFTPLDGTFETGKIGVMAYGVLQSEVKERANLLRNYGIRIISVEPTATALLAAFYVNGLLMEDKYRVCVNFGETISHFIVIRGNSVLFSRPLAGVSLGNLIQMVGRNLNIEPADARGLVLSWVKQAAADEGLKKIEATVGHYLSQLAIEIQRSLDAFCIMYGESSAQDVPIKLCGEGCNLKSLVDHLSKTLGMKVEIFSPFEKLMDPRAQTDEIKKAAPAFAIAVGLSIS